MFTLILYQNHLVLIINFVDKIRTFTLRLIVVGPIYYRCLDIRFDSRAKRLGVFVKRWLKQPVIYAICNFMQNFAQFLLLKTKFSPLLICFPGIHCSISSRKDFSAVVAIDIVLAVWKKTTSNFPDFEVGGSKSLVIKITKN